MSQEAAPLPPSSASARQTWSQKEKLEIQTYSNLHPGRTWKQVQQWFADNHAGKAPDQSQISRWKKREPPTSDEKLRPEQKRIKEGKFPELEAALFEWHQRMQTRTNITGIILQHKAHFFWINLPMYKNLPESEEPKWSTGWLSRFKQRYGIRQFIQHGEAASAPDNVEVEESMRVIQDILMYKEEHEIYNMDETALFWRMTPDSSLTTEQLSGFKKDKNRMTAALCSNADASDKCPPWFIGKSQNPRAFTNINRNTLGCHYRANKTAWMTTVIMKEWLLWFNNRMSARRRNVILLLDNFSAHNCAVEELEKEGHLTHVKVLFFLPGITSKHQPMDQGMWHQQSLLKNSCFFDYFVFQVLYEPGRPTTGAICSFTSPSV